MIKKLEDSPEHQECLVLKWKNQLSREQESLRRLCVMLEEKERNIAATAEDLEKSAANYNSWDEEEQEHEGLLGKKEKRVRVKDKESTF